MRRAVKYSLRDSRVSSQRNPAPASSPLTQESDSPRSITGNATYTSQKTPLQPQSSKTSHFESVDDILEDDHGSFGYLAQGVETSRISLNEVVSSLNDSAHPPSIPSLAAHTAVRHTFTNDVPDIRASPTLPRGILKRGISRVTSVYIHRAKSTTAHIRPSFKVSMMTAIVAIKVVKPVGPTHSIRRRRRREVITGMNLHHMNILPVYGVVMDSFGPFGGIVTPWCMNGNAVQYLHKYNLSPLERYRLWRGVVDGLVYLHSYEPQIIHGDVKPPFVSHGRGDNGGCEWLGGINTTSAHTGTPRYLAPEQVDLNRPSQPTTATDVYAVTCIGFEFIYLVVPYAHREHNLQGQIFHDIRHGVPPAPRPRTATVQNSSSSDDTAILSFVDGIVILWDILELCWSRDPRRRPSAADLRAWLVQYEGVIVDALDNRV
ncbi:hypothetical protein PIIN_10395 [Serendipita indica DSM 11827]|uniref:Protein kinase domain-containing protein n=1 Tax=Serendipita indica (strain DSM 11827) TaxID=1109443 RepID=G4TYK9_SERID|nr:hypothetical protein PIIN_10395 [Serendipita indica DSM 11827]